MTRRIARPRRSEPRCFPLPGAEHGGSSADQRVAGSILALADHAWTQVERLLGWGLDDRNRLGRVLRQHREAVAAERQGRWQRADFFWNVAHRGLHSLAGQRRLWAELSAELRFDGADQLGDPDNLRQRLIEEVFIDGHCAFYNGRFGDPEDEIAPDDRAFSHAARLAALVELCLCTPADQLAILGPTAELRIEVHEKREEWEKAIGDCQDFLRRFPDDVEFQNRLILLHLQAAHAQLKNGDDESSARADAATIQRHIGTLDELRRRAETNLLVYQTLGHLYSQCAVCLANSRELADAVDAAERALTFQPLDRGINALHKQLTKAMEKLVPQVYVLEARQPNAYLNADGQMLQKQVRRFERADKFADTAAAQHIREGFKRAQARALWRAIGLDEPADRPNERALALLAAVGKILGRSPKNRKSLARAWENVASGELAELDSQLIVEFLKSRPSKKRVEEALSEPAPGPPADDGPAPLVLASPRSRRWGDRVPVWEWLLSRESLWFKGQVLAAVVLLLLAGRWSLEEGGQREVRDSAYEQILAASADGERLALLEAAQTFLAAPPPHGPRDAREQKVWDLYRENLTRWIVEDRDVLDERDRQLIDRYIQLSGAGNGSRP